MVPSIRPIRTSTGCGPCNDPSITFGAIPAEPCGYTRVNFGGDDPTVGNLGGRALVKVELLALPALYRERARNPAISGTIVNGNGDLRGGRARLPRRRGSRAGRVRRLLRARSYPQVRSKLESVGRAGVVVTSDPTTYARSESKALLRTQ